MAPVDVGLRYRFTQPTRCYKKMAPVDVGLRYRFTQLTRCYKKMAPVDVGLRYRFTQLTRCYKKMAPVDVGLRYRSTQPTRCYKKMAPVDVGLRYRSTQPTRKWLQENGCSLLPRSVKLLVFFKVEMHPKRSDKMPKYLRILKLFWGAAIAAELEYRFNFVLAALTSIGNLAGSIFSLFLFYRTGYTFEGWSWEEAIIVLAIFTILQGFSQILLAPNLNSIVLYVQEGTLDFILLKPISSQFWLSSHKISPWGLADVMSGLILLVYAGTRLGLGAANYLLSLVPLIFGTISLYSIWFMLGATSIWFVKIYNVTEVLRALLAAGRYPMVAYPIAYRFFFTFIVPVAFLTTVPAEAMLGRVTFFWMLGSGVLAGGLLLVSMWFWRFALRFYTSASS